MILDSFKTHTLIFQIQYANAYELWDCAGAVGRRLCKVWPGLTLREGQPHQQIFVGDRAVIQTGVGNSTVTLSGDKVFEQRKVLQIKESFEIWCEFLDLDVLDRVSTRVQYSKQFPSLKEANAELFALNLARWPNTKVFEQPLESDKNGLDIAYRFEDESSFSLLRVKTEQIKAEVELDPELFDEPKITKERDRLVIDFDRGLLGSTNARKFLVDEWIKGYQHILRRDIEKVLKGAP